ncbi:MAG TPA: hypothetical protein VFR37_11140 [Longimicrobium sp.]|nr:hypothetical protein [Longimicrobium sp.]
MSTNTILYVTNYFVPYPTSAQMAEYEAWAADLGSSGFTTLMFYNMHIDASGNFRYTNASYPFVADGRVQEGYAYLQGLLASITAAGSVTNILFVLGGWGVESDYLHAGQLLGRYGSSPDSPLVRNFVALQGIGVTGIDMDLEPGAAGAYGFIPYSYFGAAVVQLTTLLRNLALRVTYCPYEQTQFWIDCLAASYGFNNVQPVSWLNLQCYSGGTGNTQAQWVAALNQSGTPLGISDTDAFVVPGYSPAETCPAALQATFADSSQMTSGVAGGFLYGYQNIQQNQQQNLCPGNNSTADYAKAIAAGIASLQG